MFNKMFSHKITPRHSDLLIHCGYHKVLTGLFHHVLTRLSVVSGLTFQETEEQSELKSATRLYFNPQSRICIDELPPFRGTHIIRDPRDLIISGYFYHLRTDEPWCINVNPESEWNLPKNSSYQQHLLTLSEADGLLFESQSVSAQTIRRMLAWNYADPRFLELRYEYVVGSERDLFNKVFRWYGFEERDCKRLIRVVDKFSLSSLNSDLVKWRRPQLQQHVSAGGVVGKWRQYFTPELKRTFLDQFGDALIDLGYESDNKWAI